MAMQRGAQAGGPGAGERSRVYVIATLGTAPGVLTELLYALAVDEGLEVVGLEAHTTTKGLSDLEDFYRKGGWGQLCSALEAAGVEPARVPLGPPYARNLLGSTAPGERVGLTSGAPTFTVDVIEQAGDALTDIRLSADALALEARLFARVRALANGLPDAVGLVGCLAGGRKTMSASLQTAFSLAARPGDRLVHVLLHPDVEKLGTAGYAAPTPTSVAASGVPADRHIALYDVQFPVLRALLGEAVLPGPRKVMEVLNGADFDYAMLTSEVRRLGAVDPQAWHGHLTRPGRSGWILTLSPPGTELPPVTVDLSPRCGVAYVALAAWPGKTPVELVQKLDAHGYTGVERQAAALAEDLPGAHADAAAYWSKLRCALEKALSQTAVGRDAALAAFAVQEQEGTEGHCIPAALEDRVRIDVADVRSGRTVSTAPPGDRPKSAAHTRQPESKKGKRT